MPSRPNAAAPVGAPSRAPWQKKILTFIGKTFSTAQKRTIARAVWIRLGRPDDTQVTQVRLRTERTIGTWAARSGAALEGTRADWKRLSISWVPRGAHSAERVNRRVNPRQNGISVFEVLDTKTERSRS
jgi:hypothetical protein